jgi:uncharacterized repeat protein (TIGR01451 family)
MWRSWTTGSLTIGAILCALVAGCATAQTSGIDPTGERVFVNSAPPGTCPPGSQPVIAQPVNTQFVSSPVASQPNSPFALDDVAVHLRPREITAPVCSEVVLVAGVCGADGYLHTNRWLEWSITPGSVGRFVAVEKGTVTDILLGDFNRPRIVNSTFAVGSTSRERICLNRPGCPPGNAVQVLRGEAWVSLTSPVEGTSNVLVVAPEVYSGGVRCQTAVVHWVAASTTRSSAATTGPTVQPSTPAPSSTPAPPSTLAPSSAPAPLAAPGAPSALGPLAAGRPSIDVRITGPAQGTVTVGSQITFQIVVTNRGSTPATGLRIKDRFDVGLEHKGTEGTSAIERSLEDIPPGASRPLAVEFHVSQSGRLCHVVEVTQQDVLLASAQGCIVAAGPPIGAAPATPPAAVNPLSIKVSGPSQLAVGETARFIIDVANVSISPLRNVKVSDHSDPPLEPTLATDGYRIEDRSLVWIIDNLPVGRSTRFEVHCKCGSAAVRACNRATAILPDGSRAENESCLEIRATSAMPVPTVPKSAASGNAPGFNPPGTARPNVTTKPTLPKLAEQSPSADELDLSVVGLSNPIRTGKELTYQIQVTNHSPVSYPQISVKVALPEGITPVWLGTTGPEVAAFNKQVIRFRPVPELRPGESLTYRVRARAEQPGIKTLRVELSTPAFSQPRVQETRTEIISQ